MAPLLIANDMTIIIIVVLALVLFGGSRIAGVGKEAEKDIEAVEADVVKDQSKPTE